MRRALWACVALVAAVAIGAEAPPEVRAPDFKGLAPCLVTRVVDGDTIHVSVEGTDTTVRLIGVDTPETVDPRKPVQAYGREASAFLKNLLGGEKVYLEYEGAQPALDKYGRTLAYVYRAPDGLFANLELVRQGYGHAYTEFPFRRMEIFRAYERRAREFGKGLWGAEVASTSRPSASPTPALIVTPTPRPVVEPPPPPAAADVTVYVTKTGKKYHRDGCSSLSRSRIPMSLKDAKASGLGPCANCNPPQ